MELDLDNKEWQDALQIINYTRRSLFLTGKAGTGKSTFLRYVAQTTKKKHVILCVIKRNQIPELRRTIRDLDESAFVIVTDAKNVFGRGFENIAEVR